MLSPKAITVLAGTTIQEFDGECTSYPDSIADCAKLDSYSNKYSSQNSISFANPVSLAKDSYGNIFVADSNNNRVRMLTWSKVVVTVVNLSGFRGFQGDSGPSQIAWLRGPESVAVDSLNCVLISDFGNQYGTLKRYILNCYMNL